MLSLALSVVAMAHISPWKLVWSDEFNRPGRPDPKKWSYEVGYIRNHEVQFYTQDRPENARVEGGHLIIEARKDGFQGHPVSSACLETTGKANWTYGRLEARIKIPTGKGTWPAFWTLGENISTEGWPKCGEIDIMENVGFEPENSVFTVHSSGKDAESHASSGANIVVPNLWKEFHVYAVEWNKDRIDWFFDGKKVHSYERDGATNVKWQFDKPQYIILNLAIGGDWGGQQGVDDSIYPSRYEIDYVRVYQKRAK